MRGLIHLASLTVVGLSGAAWWFHTDDRPGGPSQPAARQPSFPPAESFESLLPWERPDVSTVDEFSAEPRQRPARPQAGLAEWLFGREPHSSKRIAASASVPQFWLRADAGDFRSTGRRPIHSLTAGNGPRRTLVVAGLRGDDGAGVVAMDSLAAELLGQPALVRGSDLFLVRSLNPDGAAVGSRLNGRGIDLNRNFPSGDFVASAADHTGPGPGSETETRALLQMLYQFRPHRVVRIDGAADVPTVVYNAQATRVADSLVRRNGFQSVRLRDRLRPGSLESFVDGTLAAEMLVISLPPQAIRAWPDFREPVLAAALLPGASATADRTPAGGSAALTSDSRPASQGTKSGPTGYLELPPPPR